MVKLNIDKEECLCLPVIEEANHLYLYLIHTERLKLKILSSFSFLASSLIHLNKKFFFTLKSAYSSLGFKSNRKKVCNIADELDLIFNFERAFDVNHPSKYKREILDSSSYLNYDIKHNIKCTSPQEGFIYIK